MKILILGKGYLGQRCAEEWGEEAVIGDRWIENIGDVLDMINEHRPDAVLNAAGVVGKPNVDWCEDNELETVVGNTKLPILIAEACRKSGVYLLHMGTGCIFYGESWHGDPWKETDYANPGAVYTKSKYAADLVLGVLPNVGIARIRMPLDDRPTRANLIDKLASFEKVTDVENSLTVVPDMIKVFYELMAKKAEGIFHVVNRGTVKHREILKMYEEIVDPNHRNEWMSPEEEVENGIAKKKRSNNEMSSENLEKYGIEIREVKEAVRDCLEKYKTVIRQQSDS